MTYLRNHEGFVRAAFERPLAALASFSDARKRPSIHGAGVAGRGQPLPVDDHAGQPAKAVWLESDKGQMHHAVAVGFDLELACEAGVASLRTHWCSPTRDPQRTGLRTLHGCVQAHKISSVKYLSSTHELAALTPHERSAA